MNKSLGGALKDGNPVVFTSADGKRPVQVAYHIGQEAEVLDLMESMGVIQKLIIGDKTPKGCMPARREMRRSAFLVT